MYKLPLPVLQLYTYMNESIFFNAENVKWSRKLPMQEALHSLVILKMWFFKISMFLCSYWAIHSEHKYNLSYTNNEYKSLLFSLELNRLNTCSNTLVVQTTGIIRLLLIGYHSSFPRVKLSECDVCHSPSSNTKVRNEWSMHICDEAFKICIFYCFFALLCLMTDICYHIDILYTYMVYII
jgi:hypothetical protein